MRVPGRDMVGLTGLQDQGTNRRMREIIFPVSGRLGRDGDKLNETADCRLWIQKSGMQTNVAYEILYKTTS